MAGFNALEAAVELASQESVRELMDAADVHIHAAPTAVKSASRGRTRRCTCGQCERCLDDARWERIFDEKFAYPSYYTDPAAHRGSPLGSF